MATPTDTAPGPRATRQFTTHDRAVSSGRDGPGGSRHPTPWSHRIVSILTTTDHKVIGNLYLATTFVFFVLGGLLAMLMRLELATPGLQIVENLEQYNQLFTMHGAIMLLLFATPLFARFANALVPLQIGSADVAFPRLNALSYWLYLFGGLTAVSGFVTPGGAAAFGWFAYAPLSNATFSPGLGGDLWIMGLALAGFGTILGAVNFVMTIICLRAPGMTMFRLPLFTWTVLITAMMILMAFPVLTAAFFGLAGDRLYGMHIFDPANGGPILYPHLFWFFGHPEVYIIALPFFGIISEVLPVFARKPPFGYKGLIFATIAIAALSMTVWAHHMFATGAVLLPFFAFMSMLIAIPTGVKFFNWIGTLWGGSLTFSTPLIWAIGFLTTFLFGGLTGVLLASPPLDLHRHGHVFHRRALPLHGLRHRRLRDVRRLLLLVAQADRANARRAPGKAALLDALPRLPRHVPHPARARDGRDAAALRRLSRE